nr:hypothetical protein [Flavobacterium sp. ASV13]
MGLLGDPSNTEDYTPSPTLLRISFRMVFPEGLNTTEGYPAG